MSSMFLAMVLIVLGGLAGAALIVLTLCAMAKQGDQQDEIDDEPGTLIYLPRRFRVVADPEPDRLAEALDAQLEARRVDAIRRNLDEIGQVADVIWAPPIHLRQQDPASPGSWTARVSTTAPLPPGHSDVPAAKSGAGVVR